MPSLAQSTSLTLLALEILFNHTPASVRLGCGVRLALSSYSRLQKVLQQESKLHKTTIQLCCMNLIIYARSLVQLWFCTISSLLQDTYNLLYMHEYSTID